MNSNSTSEIDHCKTCKATFNAVICSMKFCVGFFQVWYPHVSITPRIRTNARWKIFIYGYLHPFSTVEEMKRNTILKLQLVVCRQSNRESSRIFMTWTKSYFNKKPPPDHSINDSGSYHDDITIEYSISCIYMNFIGCIYFF